MRSIACLVIVFYFSILNSFCQKNLSTKSTKAEKLYKDALTQIDITDFSNAEKLLKKALAIDNKFVEAYFVLGEIYSDLGEDSLAIDVLKKGLALNQEIFPAANVNVARLEMNNGLYDDALKDITYYLQISGLQPHLKIVAEMIKSSCEFAIHALKKQVTFNPQNMGPSINNQYDQYWPSLSADELTFVFTEAIPINPNNSQVYRNRQEDFFISSFENGEWTPAKSIGTPLNTKTNEGAQSLSADGTTMIFTRCYQKNCDLYISKKNNGQWSVPKNMGEPVNTVYKETQPSISPDGKVIYFSSNRKGSLGSLDLWKTTLDSAGNWGNPLNLGPTINTIMEEQSPFIHSDNNTLYFSSNGLPGMGRFDLFVTRQISDTSWTKPMNLGYPINTFHTEEGLIVNAKGNLAYYSSTREGFGGRDIFTFELYKEAQPTSVSYMKGLVYDAETHNPLIAKFELINLQSSKIVMDAVSNEDGTFIICIPTGKSYLLNINKKGYLFYSDNFTMGEGDFLDPFVRDIPLDPIKKGNKVILKNIFFDHDSYVIKNESKIELNKLWLLMKENSLMKIEISGHTDNTGQKEYNNKLSENRAKAVATFLLEKGIDKQRITWKGYGDSQPVLPNRTEEERSINRRTEFKVTGI